MNGRHLKHSFQPRLCPVFPYSSLFVTRAAWQNRPRTGTHEELGHSRFHELLMRCLCSSLVAQPSAFRC
jgi:hypothetical protein